MVAQVKYGLKVQHLWTLTMFKSYPWIIQATVFTSYKVKIERERDGQERDLSVSVWYTAFAVCLLGSVGASVDLRSIHDWSIQIEEMNEEIFPKHVSILPHPGTGKCNRCKGSENWGQVGPSGSVSWLSSYCRSRWSECHAVTSCPGSDSGRLQFRFRRSFWVEPSPGSLKSLRFLGQHMISGQPRESFKKKQENSRNLREINFTWYCCKGAGFFLYVVGNIKSVLVLRSQRLNVQAKKPCGIDPRCDSSGSINHLGRPQHTYFNPVVNAIFNICEGTSAKLHAVQPLN